MKKSIQNMFVCLVFVFVLAFPDCLLGQQNFNGSGIYFYNKKEISWGTQFQFAKEREELLTDVSKQYEEIDLGEAKFKFENRYWTFLDFKQEQLALDLNIGPIFGKGNWGDSSYVNNAVADHSIFGLRLDGRINYINRFYYSDKSYTLIQISARAKYDLFRKNSEGISIDSNGVSTDFDIKSDRTKFRYGFTARAGWGAGRLNPVNHLMVADYLFSKYYNGRTFSKEEGDKVIQEIEIIKSERSIAAGHDNNKESEQFLNFVNQQLLLTRPDDFEKEWKYGEFLPRFSGSRVEIGPFFKYYNREPDFIYGGYIQYNNEKYCSYKWNRKFNAGLNYNWYKRQDWMLAEIELGWSYFIKLQSQFDFGLKYVPGVVLNYFEDVGKINHGFIPYINYYSQINESTRINLAFAYRISEDKGLMLPGPEFSVSVYRSRY